jgi:type II secretory pathway component PulJ
MFFNRSSYATELFSCRGYLKHIPEACCHASTCKKKCTIHRSSHTDRLLVEEPNDLACSVFPSCLLMVHDTSRCCENNVAKLTRWQQLDDPFLEILERDIVSWGDDTGLVEAAVQLNDNFAIAVVVNFLELANVTW